MSASAPGQQSHRLNGYQPQKPIQLTPSLCTFVYRAGRDGAPSLSLLYCSQADLKQLKKLEKPVGTRLCRPLL